MKVKCRIKGYLYTVMRLSNHNSESTVGPDLFKGNNIVEDTFASIWSFHSVLENKFNTRIYNVYATLRTTNTLKNLEKFMKNTKSLKELICNQCILSLIWGDYKVKKQVAHAVASI